MAAGFTFSNTEPNNMLAKRLSLKLISEVTGLSDDELKKLKSKKDLKTNKLHNEKVKNTKTKKQRNWKEILNNKHKNIFQLTSDYWLIIKTHI